MSIDIGVCGLQLNKKASFLSNFCDLYAHRVDDSITLLLLLWSFVVNAEKYVFPAPIYGNQNKGPEFTTSGYQRTIEWLGLKVTLKIVCFKYPAVGRDNFH